MRIETANGLGGDYRLLDFGHDVYWLRETNSYVRIGLRDEPWVFIGEEHKVTDYCGFLTGVDDCIRYAKSYDLGKTRFAEVVTEIHDIPTIIPPSHVLNNSTAWRVHGGSRHCYLTIPSDWLLDDDKARERAEVWNNPDPNEPWKIVKTNSLHTKTTEIISWSSLNSEEENKLIYPNKEFFSTGDFVHAT